MNVKTLLTAGLLGLCLTGIAAPQLAAEVLRVTNGGPSSALNVPMNRAVVVESDTPFAELSIANPGIADISTLSDRSIYVLGKTPGRTTLTILDASARLIANVEVHVTPDIAEFRERLRQILPGEQIEVRTANDGIVMSGLVSSAENLDRALQLAERYAPDRVSNLMSVGGSHQVMLKVRFAEVQRNVAKRISSPLGGISGFGAVSTFDPPEIQPFPLAFGGTLTFQVAIEALETRGLARTLAEPNLVALSGQEAYFLAGGEVPVPVRGEDNVVTIDYKPVGIELNFTPWVVSSGKINLTLTASVSEVDPTFAGAAGVPAFNRRQTSTTVELLDGESFAIAGLLQDDFRSLATQVPWIGDLPVLGALFRSPEYRREQSELVIIISAHLVSPIRGEALALPTDRVRLPTERELFLLGRTEGVGSRPGAVGEVARQDFSGPYGYVLD